MALKIKSLPALNRSDPQAILEKSVVTEQNFQSIKSMDFIVAGAGVSVALDATAGTATISSGLTGAGGANQLAYWSAVSVLAGSAHMTWDGNSIALDNTGAFISCGVGSPGGANLEYIDMYHNGVGMAIIEVEKTGTGSYRDLLIKTGGTTRVTIASGGLVTLGGNLVVSGLTASLPVVTNGSKQLISGAVTGTGSFMLAVSPTTTGTFTAAAITTSGAIIVGGELKLSASNTVNSSVLATVTNKIKINVGGTDYYLLANTSNA